MTIKLTKVESVLFEEDLNYWTKRLDSRVVKIRRKFYKVVFNRDISNLEALNYAMMTSFFTDIAFREKYIRIDSIKSLFNIFGNKIYYRDIRFISYNGKECIIHYRKKLKVKKIRLKINEDVYKLLNRVYQDSTRF